MNGGGNSYDDFRMEPLKLDAVRYLLLQGKNDSEIAVAMSIDRHTVAKLRDRMNGRNEIKPSNKDKERRERVPTEEYQNILKMVKGLANRIKNLEGKYDKQIKLHNILANFIDNSVTPRLNIIGDEFKNIAKNITKNARDIEDLQKDVGILNEVWYGRIREIKERSEAHQTERDRVDAESNKRAAEVFREAERKREQGSTDVFQQNLKDLKNGKESY